MTINIEELKRDREAGTDGPWRVRVGHRHDPEECNLHICGDIFVLADINGPNYSHQEPNARRIARLPDLEAAFLEAVDAIKTIKCLMETDHDEAAYNLAIDFLEKLK